MMYDVYQKYGERKKGETVRNRKEWKGKERENELEGEVQYLSKSRKTCDICT